MPIEYVDYGRFVGLGDISNGGLQIPKNPANADYAIMLKRIEDGEAVLVPGDPE